MQRRQALNAFNAVDRVFTGGEGARKKLPLSQPVRGRRPAHAPLLPAAPPTPQDLAHQPFAGPATPPFVR